MAIAVYSSHKRNSSRRRLTYLQVDCKGQKSFLSNTHLASKNYKKSLLRLRHTTANIYMERLDMALDERLHSSLNAMTIFKVLMLHPRQIRLQDHKAVRPSVCSVEMQSSATTLKPSKAIFHSSLRDPRCHFIILTTPGVRLYSHSDRSSFFLLFFDQI
jgi:hypothetical protein